jgi:hypothetical protein
MKMNCILRSVFSFVPVALLSVAGLQAQQCSTAAAAGEYVLVCDGYVAPSTGAPLVPTKMLGIATATSTGTFSGGATISQGGVIESDMLSGTGSVNGGCAGSLVLSQTIGGQTGPQLSLGTVTSNGGNTIDALVAVPNFVLSCKLTRMSSGGNAQLMPPKLKEHGGDTDKVVVASAAERHSSSEIALR